MQSILWPADIQAMGMATVNNPKNSNWKSWLERLGSLFVAVLSEMER